MSYSAQEVRHVQNNMKPRSVNIVMLVTMAVAIHARAVIAPASCPCALAPAAGMACRWAVDRAVDLLQLRRAGAAGPGGPHVGAAPIVGAGL